MKMFINNKVYVQVKDIAFIMHVFPHIVSKCPKQVLTKCFNKIFICNESNKYKFIEFNDIDEIKFFRNVNFIVDYDEYKDLSFKEIVRCIENIGNDINNLSDKYQELNDSLKEKKSDKVKYLFEIKYHKMVSIREIYKIKIGELQIDLPQEEKKVKIKEKGIKKYLNKVFNKEK